MPRPKSSLPRFCVDKTGRAFTKVDGHFISLGRADSPDAKIRFAKLLEDHAKGVVVKRATRPVHQRPEVSVAELLSLYVSKELPRYSTSEQHCQKTAVRVLHQLFGDTPVSEFGPLRLRVVRDAMVAGDPDAKNSEGKSRPRKPWARKTVNRQIKRIQAIFRWGVSFEIVPESIAAALGTLRILASGETTAIDYAPRQAIQVQRNSVFGKRGFPPAIERDEARRALRPGDYVHKGAIGYCCASAGRCSLP